MGYSGVCPSQCFHPHQIAFYRIEKNEEVDEYQRVKQRMSSSGSVEGT